MHQKSPLYYQSVFRHFRCEQTRNLRTLIRTGYIGCAKNDSVVFCQYFCNSQNFCTQIFLNISISMFVLNMECRSNVWPTMQTFILKISEIADILRIRSIIFGPLFVGLLGVSRHFQHK